LTAANATRQREDFGADKFQSGQEFNIH
jgi:hypothetical protein